MVICMTGSQSKSFLAYLLALCCLLLIQGCATTRDTSIGIEQAYAQLNDNTLPGQYAPILAPQESELEYNRIGHAAAQLNEKGEEEIYIATNEALLYTQEQAFTSSLGNRYHNLIYRFHFPYVPKSHLTAGNNGGLFVVITLDQAQQPVLITTVHSCGCYLAIIPTSYLPFEAYPENWDVESQVVFGEHLPGRLNYPDEFSTDWRPVIQLRSGNHRVMDIRLERTDQLDVKIIPITLTPIESLEKLAIGDGHTSFFHDSGRLQGYAKGANKPWEKLLMSWWTFDLQVGHDKKLGDPAETGTLFYTSLKPWARQKSNMWLFANFLDYWDWKL